MSAYDLAWKIVVLLQNRGRLSVEKTAAQSYCDACSKQHEKGWINVLGSTMTFYLCKPAEKAMVSDSHRNHYTAIEFDDLFARLL